MLEIWKIVKETNNKQARRFEVSNIGRRRVTSLKSGEILILDYGNGTKYKSFGIIGSAHRAIALAFIPNPENKLEVNHIDGNKLNNHVDNLEWCTRSENAQHMYDTGLIDKTKLKFARAEKHPHLGVFGKKHPAYGIKHTDETKAKISKASIGENNGNYNHTK